MKKIVIIAARRPVICTAPTWSGTESRTGRFAFGVGSDACARQGSGCWPARRGLSVVGATEGADHIGAIYGVYTRLKKFCGKNGLLSSS